MFLNDILQVSGAMNAQKMNLAQKYFGLQISLPLEKLTLKMVVMRSINKSKVQSKRLHYGDIILEKSGGTEKTPVGRVVFCVSQ